MTAPEWTVKRPADLIADAEELLQNPAPDRGVAWTDQWKAATEEAVHLVEHSIRSVSQMDDAVTVAFPPGDPAKTALLLALELQARQRVAVTRTCRHAPIYAPAARESRQVRRGRQRAQEAGPRPIMVMMGAGIASCQECIGELSRQVLATGIPDQAADGRCGCCGEHLADGFYSCSATAGSIIFMFDACEDCRDFAACES